MKILAIETSCDETSCAVVENGRSVLSNVTATQIEEHKLYGGVVPEIASRRHCEGIVGVCEQALLQAANTTLESIDAIAVTYAPGLIGALLVGVNFAKGIALAHSKPLIPVHHIKAHIASNYIAHPELKPPFVALVVSGGHTSIVRVKNYIEFEVVGSTLDDAAGEAFDKAARAMGFSYPGGIYIDKQSKLGDAEAYKLPNPKTESPYDFSFSGLKTAIVNLIHNTKQAGNTLTQNQISDLCASFQNTACNILTDKTIRFAHEQANNGIFADSAPVICLCGGVAANSGLREKLLCACNEGGYKLYFPPLEYCGDNAAMVGCQAYYENLYGGYNSGENSNSLNAYATMGIS
ncbi:MAG: tRNA (adenosine(37)-N6)-threonylcarbamoyltransferase complex transferase subunit TsaD [Oscillospiraceae bacterium]|nr:tRNA (adenosine(37)-N6)-threonylcarbamoyltransferase complex transferase subunit TsaD [Oscillospiraceae bacterium]